MTGTGALGLAVLGWWAPGLLDGEVVRWQHAWMPALGLDFSLYIDGLAALFALLVFGIGILVAIYARYYMPAHYPLKRFYTLMLAFMGAMLGIVMAGNVIQLVFFWELTSLVSFLLIGYWHQGESARDAARTALIVTGGGGLCLLGGALLLGHIVGSYDLGAILASGDTIRNSPLYEVTLVLILLGALSKSAQFPFHFWLPQAMSAPTPVSAYLHSATMVKAGVFLLLRFWPVLAGTDAWFWGVGTAGLVSLLLGAWIATFQQDLKAILAYSTISHLGLIMMMVGFGSTLGVVAALFHVINHATFKASLFMAAGAIDHEAGTRDLRRLGGLRRLMPITATLALISGAAMAGVPLLNGFLSKEMFFAVTLGSDYGTWVDTGVVLFAVLAAGLSVAYSLRLLVGTFFGPVSLDSPRSPGEPPRWMRVPIALLSLLCLLVGILPARVVGPVLHAAAAAVLGAELPVYSLQLWHGFTWPLVMSIAAFASGCVFYVVTRSYLAEREATAWIAPVSARRVFEWVMVMLTETLPRWQQAVFPARHLQVQLRVLFGMAAGVAALVLVQFAWQVPAPGRIDVGLAVLWLVGSGCAIGAARQAKFHRMTALMLSGGAGLAVAITFVWLSAPDLAATQLLVESVTTVLLLLGLRWLPKRIPGLVRSSPRTRRRRLGDFLIASVAGGGMGMLAYLAMLHPLPDAVSRFFIENALPGGGGRNVVNVILVDFRSFDTLGEITVLAIVALSIYGVLRRFRPANESLGTPHLRLQAKGGDPAMRPAHPGATLPGFMAVPARLVLLVSPFALLFAVHLLVRGHNLPGGGFVAGLAVTLVLIVLCMARGVRWVEARVRVAPLRWIAFGWLLALATGTGAMLLGRPFLTSWHGSGTLPVLGTWHFASALFFDLGVFAVVVGVATLILIALAHQSVRAPIGVVRHDDTEPT